MIRFSGAGEGAIISQTEMIIHVKGTSGRKAPQ